jgi:hypothetical protein
MFTNSGKSEEVGSEKKAVGSREQTGRNGWRRLVGAENAKL